MGGHSSKHFTYIKHIAGGTGHYFLFSRGAGSDLEESHNLSACLSAWQVFSTQGC